LVLVIAHVAVALGGHSLVIGTLVNPFTQLIDWLASIVSWGLESLYAFAHNYGWAMILLALAVSLLLLPLTIQQLRSMTEM
jgi:membrane protein insertase Oxa1/YidC/SpoIIIJ